MKLLPNQMFESKKNYFKYRYVLLKPWVLMSMDLQYFVCYFMPMLLSSLDIWQIAHGSQNDITRQSLHIEPWKKIRNCYTFLLVRTLLHFKYLNYIITVSILLYQMRISKVNVSSMRPKQLNIKNHKFLACLILLVYLWILFSK